MVLLTTLATTVAAVQAGGDLIENGSFESGFDGWTTTGPVSIGSDAHEGSNSARLEPRSNQTAELSQWIEDLTPRGRYTIAARIRTTDRLVPPILGVRNGAQIGKAHGWVAIDDENRWLERRFEVHVDEDATAFEVYLQGWQTDRDAIVEFDSVRAWEGRQPPPEADPGEPPWAEAPVITIVPDAGDSLLRNPSFDDPDGGAWALGINASIQEIDATPTLQLLSTADTSRASQPLDVLLPPEGEWLLSVDVRTDPDVVGTVYFTGADEFLVTRSFSNSEWETIELDIRTNDQWLRQGKLTLENWKNQPGSAWFRDVRFTARGDEWSPTVESPPARTSEVFFDDFSDGTLDPDRWLISGKAWGGDNGGVAPDNVILVEDFDDGEPIVALRLEAHGDLYSGDLEHNGRTTRVGAAIATRSYYASGRYEVRARVAPEYGTCTAFWPFHYIDHRMGEAEYWHEPNPRRNTEIDWEFPTDLAGSDTGNFAFTKARTNSWGGQFGGEGGEHKGRKVLTDEFGKPLDLATEARDGRYHTFTIEWRSGSDLGDEAINRDRRRVGPVAARWTAGRRTPRRRVRAGQRPLPRGAVLARHLVPGRRLRGRRGLDRQSEFRHHRGAHRLGPDHPVRRGARSLGGRDGSESRVGEPRRVSGRPIDPIDSVSADINLDGRVDGGDLAILLAAWNTALAEADLDGSGLVDGGDLARLLADWTMR